MALPTRHAARAQIVARLLNSPGTWLPAGTFPDRMAADHLARHINGAEGVFGKYGTKGDYSTRTRSVEDGFLVEARYLEAAPPKPRVDAPGSPDTQRVLQQIAHGEIWCGPEAARAIAARHEEAYGAAWRRKPAQPTDDTAWADACAALSPTTSSSAPLNGAA
jgi:hypothetical protein